MTKYAVSGFCSSQLLTVSLHSLPWRKFSCI